jgi:hypothetical protein
MIVGRQQLGLDIFGLNIDVNKALQAAGGAAQTSVFGQVAQNPQVQQAGIATAQQSTADAISKWLLANQKPILYGLAVVAAFGLYKMIRR